MGEFERIVRAYESGLRQLADDVVAGLDLPPDERDHVALLTHLLQSLVRAYGAHHLARAQALDTSTSVMYAAAEAPAGKVLNVPLRSLVEYNTVTPWQARFLNGSLGTRKTILVTGPAGAGKSTLLQALVQLIPVDQRMVAIEEKPELPALTKRSFTVHLAARPGTPAFATALRKAAGMKPTWLLAGQLDPGDGPTFLKALEGGLSGLTTLETPDPEVTLTDWITTDQALGALLARIAPLIVHMGRDQGGRPRILTMFEALADESGRTLRVIKRRPS